MKWARGFAYLFTVMALAGLSAHGQGQRTLIQPDCVIDFSFNAAGQTQGGVGTCGNNQQGVTQWTLTYKSTGFSVLSLRVESASDNGGVPGAWGAFGGTAVTGINPNTAITQASTQLLGFFPWVRVSLTSVTGIGTITGELYGCRQPGCSGGFARTGGTVTNVSTGCGLSGGPITSTGTIARAEVPNEQAGASYLVANADCGNVVTFSNSGAVAVTLPPTGSGGGFLNGWFADFAVEGSGLVTITTSISTIDGQFSLPLFANQGVRIVSDGVNYFTVRGFGTVSSIVVGCGLNGGGANGNINVLQALSRNAQTGASYLIIAGDCGHQLTFSNAGAVAVSLPQGGTAGFANGWFTVIKNIGAGDVTVTPAVSTISGAASITVSTGEFCIVTGDGANYEADCNRNIQGANMTLTKTRTGTTYAASSGAAALHSVTFVIAGASGGAITTGALNVFPPIDFSCTINRIDVSGTPSGSITVDIWKANAAIPTAANKISASAPATLASSTLSQNGSLAAWTTAVSVGDVFGGTIVTAATVTVVTIVLWCQ